MKQESKDKANAAGMFGAIAVALAACVACCIPLIVPILAWLGLSVLGATATGWYLAMTGIFALGVAAVILYRHRKASTAAAHTESCCSGPSCKI